MKILLSVWFVCLFCILSAAQTAAPDDDNQFWNETQLVVWSDKKTEVAVNGFFRFGRDFSFPTDLRGGVSFSRRPSKYLTITGSYLYRLARPLENRKTYENRLTGAVTINLPLKNKFRLADRNQFEYKSFNSRPNVREYRNRLRIDREITVGKTKITPFGFGEVFVNDASGWYRTRFTGGLSKKLTPKITGELFYQRQNDGVSRPGNLNIIGTYLKIYL